MIRQLENFRAIAELVLYIPTKQWYVIFPPNLHFGYIFYEEKPKFQGFFLDRTSAFYFCLLSKGYHTMNPSQKYVNLFVSIKYMVYTICSNLFIGFTKRDFPM